MLPKIKFSKGLWCCIIAVELLLLFLYYFKLERRETAEVYLTQDDLLYDSGEGGFYLDTSFGNSCITTPDIVLPKGLYTLEAEIEYAGDNKLDIRYTDEQHEHYISGDIFFSNPAGIFYDFEIKYADRPLAVRGMLAQNAKEGDYILIRSLKITPSSFAVKLYLFRLMMLLAVIDGFLLLFTLKNKFEKFHIDAETGSCMKALFLLIFISSIPLMVNYVFSQDLLFHLTRIEGLVTGLQNGMFPVKIQPNWLNGHGYATSVFYGDLFLYIPAALRLLGVSIQTTYRFYVLLVNTATILISYYCFTKMSSRRIGLVCTIVYSLNIYRLVCIYKRGALGEYTAMIFLPLVLYGLWCIYTLPEESKEHERSWLPLTMGCTGIFMSHMISTEMTAFFIALSAVILWKKTFRRRTLLVLCKAVAATVLLSLWFLVPFLDCMTDGSYLINSPDMYMPWKIEEGGAAPAQLFMVNYSVYGTFGAGEGVKGEMPHTVGIAAVLTLAGWFLLCAWKKERDKTEKRQEYFALFLCALSLFMATYLFPYTGLAKLVSILEMPVSSVQFPWRFLTIAGVTLTYLLCLILKKEWIARKKRVLFAAVVVCLSLWQGLSYMSECLNYFGSTRAYRGENLTTFNVGSGEYLPVDWEEEFKYEEYLGAYKNQLTYDTEAVNVEEWHREKGAVAVSLTNNTEEIVQVEVPLLLYKGYRAVTDRGEELQILPGESYRISVSVPAEFTGSIRVTFTEPGYWRVCELISLFMLAGIVLFSIWTHWRKKAFHKGETYVAENQIQ